MWIQRLVLHPSSDKTFSQILTQKICQGPSMDSTLGTASRHHDKNLQCDYFDAKCCQRSLKRFEKVLHKKKQVLIIKVIFNVCNFTMSCFKSIVMISKSEDFYAPLLLERWIQTEASGGICSGVLRVSPICTDCLGTILSKVGTEHRQLVSYAGTTNSMQKQ